MNCLDFEVRRSKVKVMTRPNIVKNAKAYTSMAPVEFYLVKYLQFV